LFSWMETFMPLAGITALFGMIGAYFGGQTGMLLTPIAAMLIQMAVSRGCEFEADRGGAEICGAPEALASALAKIERAAKGEVLPAAEEHPATAQMMIINPLAGGGLSGLFSTHPHTAERIERLMALGRS